MPRCHDEAIIRYIAEIEVLKDCPIYAVVPKLAIESPSDEVEASIVYEPRGNVIPPIVGHGLFCDQNRAKRPRHNAGSDASGGKVKVFWRHH